MAEQGIIDLVATLPNVLPVAIGVLTDQTFWSNENHHVQLKKVYSNGLREFIIDDFVTLVQDHRHGRVIIEPGFDPEHEELYKDIYATWLLALYMSYRAFDYERIIPSNSPLLWPIARHYSLKFLLPWIYYRKYDRIIFHLAGEKSYQLDSKPTLKEEEIQNLDLWLIYRLFRPLMLYSILLQNEATYEVEKASSDAIRLLQYVFINSYRTVMKELPVDSTFAVYHWFDLAVFFDFTIERLHDMLKHKRHFDASSLLIGIPSSRVILHATLNMLNSDWRSIPKSFYEYKNEGRYLNVPPCLLYALWPYKTQPVGYFSSGLLYYSTLEVCKMYYEDLAYRHNKGNIVKSLLALEVRPNTSLVGGPEILWKLGDLLRRIKSGSVKIPKTIKEAQRLSLPYWELLSSLRRTRNWSKQFQIFLGTALNELNQDPTYRDGFSKVMESEDKDTFLQILDQLSSGLTPLLQTLGEQSSDERRNETTV